VNSRDVASFKSANYKLNLNDPMRHLRTELDRGSPRSFSEMARTYDHLPQSDLARVALHEKTDDPKLWLLQTAARILAEYLDIDGDTVALKEGLTARALHFAGRPIHPFVKKGESAYDKAHATFGDPFHPLTGRFSVNIRDPGDLSELKASMQAVGWLDSHPAIVDERGVLLVGHRRMAVAKELGIEPRLVTLPIGQGDHADAQRLKLAIFSNLGHKGFTPTERKKIAEYLKVDQGWSQQAIAAALDVSQYTVSKDLEGIIETYNSPEVKKRRGRPRTKDLPSSNERAAQAAREIAERGEEPTIAAVRAATGLGETPAKHGLTAFRALNAVTALDSLRTAWGRATSEERAAFLKEISHDLDAHSD
jgi:ParB-like chromosome segregation protein Spo0J